MFGQNTKDNFDSKVQDFLAILAYMSAPQEMLFLCILIENISS